MSILDNIKGTLGLSGVSVKQVLDPGSDRITCGNPIGATVSITATGKAWDVALLDVRLEKSTLVIRDVGANKEKHYDWRVLDRHFLASKTALGSKEKREFHYDFPTDPRWEPSDPSRGIGYRVIAEAVLPGATNDLSLWDIMMLPPSGSATVQMTAVNAPPPLSPLPMGAAPMGPPPLGPMGVGAVAMGQAGMGHPGMGIAGPPPLSPPRPLEPSPSELVNQARAQAAAGQIDQAKDTLNHALANNQHPGEALLMLGHLAAQQGDREHAAMHYWTSITRDPGNTLVARQAIRSLLDLGDFDRALAAAGQARTPDPNSPELLVLTGEAYLRKQDFRSAATHFMMAEAALTGQQRDAAFQADFAGMRAYTHYQLGEYPVATEYARRAVQLVPGQAWASAVLQQLGQTA